MVRCDVGRSVGRIDSSQGPACIRDSLTVDVVVLEALSGVVDVVLVLAMLSLFLLIVEIAESVCSFCLAHSYEPPSYGSIQSATASTAVQVHQPAVG
jgi:hypothetical protein